MKAKTVPEFALEMSNLFAVHTLGDKHPTIIPLGGIQQSIFTSTMYCRMDGVSEANVGR